MNTLNTSRDNFQSSIVLLYKDVLSKEITTLWKFFR